METLCVHCGMPILDDDCYEIKGKGYLHIDCHDGFRDSTSKSRLDREFVKLHNMIYGSNETATQDIILKRWKKHDSRKYNNKRMKAIKAEYESKGAKGAMLNELLKDFTGHPNAIRIFIETTFKNPTFKAKGYEGMRLNHENPLFFDLMLIELTKAFMAGDDLIANKMMVAMYEVDRSKTAKVVEITLKERLNMPNNIYRNSMIYRILDQAPLGDAIKVALELPDSLEWNPGVLMTRFSELDYIAERKGVQKLLKKHKENPTMWMHFGAYIFDSEEVHKDIDMVRFIALNTQALIRSGRIYEYAENYKEVNWSSLVAGLIRGISSPAYDAFEDIEMLRSQMSMLDLWDDDCSEAFFAMSEPAVYDVLRGTETIFDEFE